MVAVVVGCIGGAINGILISRLNITPILCTLGTQMAFTGITVVVSDGRAVTVGSPEPLASLGEGTLAGVPIGFLVFALAASLIGALLKFTPYGLWLMLMGTNPKAATFAGFPKTRC